MTEQGNERHEFPIDSGALRLVFEYPTEWRGQDGYRTVRLLLSATEVFAAALATMAAKDQHYGGAWREQGWRGNLARLMSKTARLRKMLWRQNVLSSTGEPVQDTIIDMINLCAFMQLNRMEGNEWGPENG